MAITVTQRGAVNTATDADPVSIASVALTVDKVYIAVICTSAASGDAPAVDSISGTGLSMTRRTVTGSDGLYASRRVDLWYGKCTSSGTVTIDAQLAATSTQSDLAIYELDGVDTGGTNGANAIVQAVCSDKGGTSDTTLSITLASFADSNNRPFAFCQHRANEATAHDSGGSYTELLDAAHNSPSGGFCVQWHETSADTGPDFSWTTSSQCGGIAVELAIAPSGGSTLEVPSATLTLAEHVPTLSDQIPVPSATLTLAEHVPTLLDAIPVPSATLTLDEQVPTLVEGTSLAVPNATLTLDAQVPTLVEGVSLPVPNATLTLDEQIPTLSEGVVVPNATLTLNEQIPTLSDGIVVPDATLTLNEQVPTLAFSIPIPDGPLTLTGQVPTLSAGEQQIEVPAAALTLTAFAPIPMSSVPNPVRTYGPWLVGGVPGEVVLELGDEFYLVVSGPSADAPKLRITVPYS